MKNSALLPARTCGFRRVSRGQSLPGGLVLAGIAGATLVAVYNLGQIALARARLTHAADAAALSVAVVQARTLNLIAHIQRTQVGHQVALAHLVTLSAWSSFADVQHRQHARGNPPGMLIGMFFGPAHKRAYAASGAASPVLQGALHRALNAHQDTAHDDLAELASSMVKNLSSVRDSTLRQVLELNLGAATAASLSVDVTYDDLPDLLLAHATGDKDGALSTLVRAASARYAFLAPRHATAANAWLVDKRCPWNRHILKRQGVTWMDDAGHWQALDHQSLHAVRSNRSFGCYYREYAMGWGQTGSGSTRHRSDGASLPTEFSREAFWKWATRSAAWNIRTAENRLAGGYARSRAASWRQRGLPSWYGIRQGRRCARINVAMAQPVETLNQASRFRAPGLQGGRFLTGALGTAEQVHATSAAQIYFDPPDNQRERTSSTSASMFRPYWRARLVAPTNQSDVAVGRQSGQALVETLSISLVIGAMVLGFAQIGGLSHRILGHDHASRMLALSGRNAKEIDHVSPAMRSRASIAKGVPLAVEPGGANAAEMRRAWAMSDTGIRFARVGTRKTAVLEDAGYRPDDVATQKRLARSETAWGRAGKASALAARRVEGHARHSDSSWRRAPPDSDWFARWTGIGTTSRGQRDKRRRRQPTAGARLRRRNRMIGQYLAGKLWCCCFAFAGNAQACPVFVHLPHNAAHAWREAHHHLQPSMQDIRALPIGAGQMHVMIWAGVPLVYAEVSIAGGMRDVAMRLTRELPALRDLAVLKDGVALSGVRHHTHWLARGTFDDQPRFVGTISAMAIGKPLYDTRAPAWLPPNATTLTHAVTRQDDSNRSQILIIWNLPMPLERARSEVSRALISSGWNVDLSWADAECSARVDIVSAADSNNSRVWLHARSKTS